jgi:hypothetical protein
MYFPRAIRSGVIATLISGAGTCAGFLIHRYPKPPPTNSTSTPKTHNSTLFHIGCHHIAPAANDPILLNP